jgi:hypothetical protein
MLRLTLILSFNHQYRKISVQLIKRIFWVTQSDFPETDEYLLTLKVVQT